LNVDSWYSWALMGFWHFGIGNGFEGCQDEWREKALVKRDII
jgi:hypothetical protein